MAFDVTRPVMDTITEDHAIAMFFFSSVAAVYALANECPSSQNTACPDPDPIDSFVLYFNLARGVHTLVRHHWSFLEHSWIGPLFQDEETVLSPAGPPDRYPGVAKVQDLITNSENERHRQIYTHALDRWLAYVDVFEKSTEFSVEDRLLLVWPILVGAEYLTLLTARAPVALIILAHYAVMISLRPSAWWAARWPVKVMYSMAQSLGSEWSGFLAWPYSQLNNRGGGPDAIGNAAMITAA